VTFHADAGTDGILRPCIYAFGDFSDAVAQAEISDFRHGFRAIELAILKQYCKFILE
jgi:hypothetical protein